MRCSNTDGKGDGALIQVVCAVEHDGRSERVLTLAFEVPSKSFNLHSAILEAVKDFLSSEEGKRVWEYNSHTFNWADFSMHINSAYCERHGFSLVDSERYSDQVVNWDEDLADHYESDCEDDED